MARTAIDATDATLEEPLPHDLGANLQTLFDRPDRPETVRDWVDAVRNAVEAQFDRDVGVEDLCHVPDSEHVTDRLDDDGELVERYHFACFFDGLVLAGMTDDPVRVETTCPETGADIGFEGTLDDLDGDAAVVSIGVTNDPIRIETDAGTAAHGDEVAADDDTAAQDDDEAAVDTAADAGSFEHVYGATCPYVRAFATEAAYEEWRETVDAATTALSPAVALAAAQELTG